ncbi:MAG: DsbA family protein [Phycisphaeraceae bacterium]
MLNETLHIFLTVLVLLLSGAGAWLSAQLLKRHDNIWQSSADEDTSLFAKLCRAASLGSGKGCDQSTPSAWSQVPIPLPRPHRDLTITWIIKRLPVAFVGLAWFAIVAVWMVMAGRPGDVAIGWHGAFVGMAVLASLASIGLIAVMASGRAPWCGGCALTHAVNVLLTSVMFFWFVEVTSVLSPAAANPSLVPVLRAIAVATVAILGLFLYRRAHLVTRDHLTRLQPFKSMVDSLQNDEAFLMREWMAQPKVAIPSREGFTGDGPRVVVFTDFECPGCFCTARELRDHAEHAFNGKLHVEVRHYPLCTTCNDKVDHDPHPNACDAACAAEAARLLGGTAAFDRMHDLLFLHSRKLGPATYRQLAAQAGLDADQLITTMKAPAVLDVVRADVELADAIGVTGTPTMYFDGRLIPAVCRTARFWKAVARRGRHQIALPLAPIDNPRKAVA